MNNLINKSAISKELRSNVINNQFLLTELATKISPEMLEKSCFEKSNNDKETYIRYCNSIVSKCRVRLQNKQDLSGVQMVNTSQHQVHVALNESVRPNVINEDVIVGQSNQMNIQPNNYISINNNIQVEVPIQQNTSTNNDPVVQQSATNPKKRVRPQISEEEALKVKEDALKVKEEALKVKEEALKVKEEALKVKEELSKMREEHLQYIELLPRSNPGDVTDFCFKVWGALESALGNSVKVKERITMKHVIKLKHYAEKVKEYLLLHNKLPQPEPEEFQSKAIENSKFCYVPTHKQQKFLQMNTIENKPEVVDEHEFDFLLDEDYYFVQTRTNKSAFDKNGLLRTDIHLTAGYHSTIKVDIISLSDEFIIDKIEPQIRTVDWMSDEEEWGNSIFYRITYHQDNFPSAVPPIIVRIPEDYNYSLLVNWNLNLQQYQDDVNCEARIFLKNVANTLKEAFFFLEILPWRDFGILNILSFYKMSIQSALSNP